MSDSKSQKPLRQSQFDHTLWNMQPPPHGVPDNFCMNNPLLIRPGFQSTLQVYETKAVL